MRIVKPNHQNRKYPNWNQVFLREYSSFKLLIVIYVY
ncbi:hypothetical protein J2S10_002478 [Neobacillus ginsengisoli]|uniref:Uncharacterized protein n=1 Tax=Neobacillus ginsengisoli TaxID=904295 RepID=A0ABT9XVN6_9BACI|nr:hypothetical protein [Neobacillus ginsengisoli]